MTDEEIMTNEEAVAILENAIKKPNTRDGYLGQALTMAIEALKQQNFKDKTNGDVIKAMFPNVRILDMSEVGVVQLVWEGIDVFLGESRNFSCEWWNSPYKESDKE